MILYIYGRLSNFLITVHFSTFSFSAVQLYLPDIDEVRPLPVCCVRIKCRRHSSVLLYTNLMLPRSLAVQKAYIFGKAKL